MKKLIFFALVVFISQNLFASEFNDCSFKKIEKDKSGDGISMIFNCRSDGTTKCYVRNNVKSYNNIESGGIWAIIPNKNLMMVKSNDSGRSELTTQRNGRVEGWFIGDCVSFYYKEAMFDVAKNKKIEAIIDDTNLPFVEQPEVLGTWRAVDFVERTGSFEPGKKQWKQSLFLKELVFKQKGKIKGPYSSWTKGVTINKDMNTASTYEIQNIDGKDYMFLEWKSGDYSFRHEDPWYYVLEKAEKAKNKK